MIPQDPTSARNMDSHAGSRDVAISTLQIDGVAKYLLSPDALPLDREACIRSGASRAYYATMLEVRDAVESKTGFRYSNAALCKWLKQHNQAAVRAVGVKLHAFKLKRQLADYEIAKAISLPDLKASATDRIQIQNLLASAMPLL